VSYLANVFAYRILAVWPTMPGANKVARLETRGGDILYYRRNRGDIQGIREIYLDEIYRLPDGAAPTSLVDFGANIGIATVWLSRRYNLTASLSVEPVPENYALLVQNLAANDVAGQTLQAAVGTSQGTVNFDRTQGTNMGRVGEGNLEVALHDVNQLVTALTFDPSLLKVDIEGAERDLFVTNTPSWVDAFSLIVIEVHPEHVEPADLEAAIVGRGFRYFPPLEISNGIRRSKRERLFVRQPSPLRR
jgi:FkbM family methyltransferase